MILSISIYPFSISWSLYLPCTYLLACICAMTSSLHTVTRPREGSWLFQFSLRSSRQFEKDQEASWRREMPGIRRAILRPPDGYPARRAGNGEGSCAAAGYTQTHLFLCCPSPLAGIWYIPLWNQSYRPPKEILWQKALFIKGHHICSKNQVHTHLHLCIR